jgi:hypothetical protein
LQTTTPVDFYDLKHQKGCKEPESHLYPMGHFELESFSKEIGATIQKYLAIKS